VVVLGSHTILHKASKCTDVLPNPTTLADNGVSYQMSCNIMLLGSTYLCGTAKSSWF